MRGDALSITQKEEDFKKVLKKLLLEKQKSEFIDAPESQSPEERPVSMIPLKEHFIKKQVEAEKGIEEGNGSSQEVIADLKLKLEKVRPTLKKING